MKKLIAFITGIFFCVTLFAEPPNTVVFFGDSLTDNGNLYKSLFHIIPKSPPYYQGRFSNGTVWAEAVAKHYSASANFAVGGATVILRSPFSGFLPYTFSEEVNSFLFETKPAERSAALYVIWIGANDYLNGQPDVPGTTTQVVDEIGNQIIRLINNGAQKFLIFNLPDLSKAPYAKSVSYAQNLHDLTMAHNQLLTNKISILKNEYPNVTFLNFDAFSLYNDIAANPQKYNSEYHINLTDTTDACWNGGYTVKQDKNRLTTELQSLKLKDKNGKLLADNDIQKLADHIISSPSLAEAYRVGKAYENNIEPCSTPDQYAFWDHVHPSAVLHQVFGQIVWATLNKTTFNQ